MSPFSTLQQHYDPSKDFFFLHKYVRFHYILDAFPQEEVFFVSLSFYSEQHKQTKGVGRK